jgi:hypothetical protein
MKSFVPFLFKLLLSSLFTVTLIEIGLRLFPAVVPLNLLVFFFEQPRTEIAQRLGLATRANTILLERDDGGPELRIFKPYTKLVNRIKETGAVIEVVTDENGFCNPHGSYQLPTIDLITLGDSFTVCHTTQAQDTWTGQLAALTGYSAYNLGREAIGIHSYLQILKRFGLQKSPKIVIMNVYEGNDLRDARRYYNHLHDTDENEEEETDALPGPIKMLEDYSYAYSLIYSFVKYLQNPDYTGQSEDQDDGQSVNFRYNLVFSDQTVIPFNLENTDKDEVSFARRLRDKAVDVGVAKSVTEALTTFVELSKQYHFVPIVTYTPSAYTAYANQVVFEDPELSELMPYFSQEQRRFLRQTGQSLGYIFIDLTPGLQAAAQAHGPQELLYSQYDLHLTPLGHAVIARVIGKALEDLDILKKKVSRLRKLPQVKPGEPQK